MDLERLTSDYLHMHWLRPENVAWDVHANRLAAPYLQGDSPKLEIGVGNGCTSFMHLGGRFRPEYDWYFNVDTAGFWQNRDIYDTVTRQDIASFIAERPRHRFRLVVDHKASLIAQARQLDLSDDYAVRDANEPFALPEVEVVFSNMLYWLNDPAAVFRWISDAMPPGARLVTVFPNRRYREYSRSFAKENRLWTLLNRGRADCNFWSLDPEDLERLAVATDLTVERMSLYLSRQTLTVMDIGLRPVSPYLIRMANALDPQSRFSIKREWCEGLLPLILECVREEMENGPREGGYVFAVLRKS